MKQKTEAETKTPTEYEIRSDSVRGKLTSLLVQQPTAQVIIEAWLAGRSVLIPQGMTPRVECTFTISIVPIPPSNGQVQ